MSSVLVIIDRSYAVQVKNRMESGEIPKLPCYKLIQRASIERACVDQDPNAIWLGDQHAGTLFDVGPDYNQSFGERQEETLLGRQRPKIFKA